MFGFHTGHIRTQKLFNLQLFCLLPTPARREIGVGFHSLTTISQLLDPRVAGSYPAEAMDF
jgi:hypothetical protein